MNEATMESSGRANSIGTGIWIVLGVIILVWGAYWVWVSPLVTESKFDPLNALFSGLAFWGVIYAILLQKSELALQRKELELTRGEVQGQKEQLQAQSLTLKQQRFQNTFFSLLEFCESMTSSEETKIMVFTDPVNLKGRDCFFQYYKEFQGEYTKVKHKSPELSNKELCDIAFSQFIQKRRADFKHYFGAFYNLVEFVSDSEIDPKDFYINIVRTQLSSHQMALLFYSSLSCSGSPHFKPLIERVHFFRNFPCDILVDQSHTKLYDASAFNCG